MQWFTQGKDNVDTSESSKNRKCFFYFNQVAHRLQQPYKIKPLILSKKKFRINTGMLNIDITVILQ